MAKRPVKKRRTKAPAKRAAKKKPGRPRKVIDWELVSKLCHIQCTGPEIAAVLSIDEDTLTNACKRDHKVLFQDWARGNREGGKASLRRMQWKAAEGGDRTMLVWLGKNVLGQADKQEIAQHNTGEPTKIQIYMPDNGRVKT